MYQKINVGKAERMIAEILRRLEIDTSETVESICLSKIEVTGVDDDRRQEEVRVVIELYRVPGHRWAK